LAALSHRLTKLTAAGAAAFPAVQLFVERVTALVENFALTDANARLVVDICRQLDGLPLAIEFAAPRVEVLGLEALAGRLHSHSPVFGAQRRTTMPRHRTMRAVVDWSYGLLSEDEQVFFRALGVFSGDLTVDAAAAVAALASEARIDTIDLLADLVAKSVVVADVGGARPRFRLLDTTRAYAIEKLEESGERERIARRHAEYYRRLFARAEAEAPVRPTSEWLADYGQDVDNLRVALDWAFSPGGEASTGVALTAAAVPLWIRLSLLEECRGRVHQALRALGTASTEDPRDEMRWYAALGATTPSVPEIGPVFTKVLDIAESLGDCEYQLRALRGLYSYHTGSSRYRAALPFAQRFHDLAMRGSDPNDRLYGEYMMGLVKHFLGDQTSAWRHLEQVLTHYDAIDHGQTVIRFITDLRMSARVFLARLLWLQGFSDQTVRIAEMSIGEAQATGHAWSVCYALALAACPIALWVGNLGAAAHYAGMLVDHSRRHALPLFGTVGSRLERLVVLKGGDVDKGSRLLGSGLDEITEPDWSFWFLTGLSELAEALAHAGRMEEGLALLEAGIEQSEAAWRTPELLRLKGELLSLHSGPAVAETAEDLFRRALDGARRQGTLSWELRAATSLARLLRNQGRPVDATVRLQPIYDRFTEGFDTADLVAAKQLLDALYNAGHD
jgi:predicted ATPase